MKEYEYETSGVKLASRAMGVALGIVLFGYGLALGGAVARVLFGIAHWGWAVSERVFGL